MNKRQATRQALIATAKKMATQVEATSLQAITTHYRQPLWDTPGRVIARCSTERFRWDWDKSLSTAGNHAAAALSLAAKLGWNDVKLAMGAAPTRSGYVFIPV